MAVHHVHMDAIGSRALSLGHLLAQAEKIGGENGRGNFDGALAHGVFNLVGSGCSFHTKALRSLLFILFNRGRLVDALNGASSRALNSASDCWADRPSTNAREKLATTP